MATLDQLLREFRRAVIALDVDTARDLVRAHREQIAVLSPAMRSLTDLLRRSGAIDDPERWVRDIDAAQRLLLLAERGMAEFGAYAVERIESRRLELIELAAEHDDDITYASLVGNAQVTPATERAIRAALSAIPVEAVTSTVGALQVGSPVRELFDGFGEAASRRLGEALVDGITRGRGAEQVARAMRDALDGDAARALTIARTEMHRAYRSASLDRYRAQPQVWAGWTWHASLDGVTCPVCVALHGTEHSSEQEFGSHPNCRCRPIPKPRPLQEILGFDDDEVRALQARVAAVEDSRETGDTWFRRQSEADQRAMLGEAKWKAWRANRITLTDVVLERDDPRWGRVHRTASLRQALANANARRLA